MLAIFFDANGVLYYRDGRHRHLRGFLAQHGYARLSSDEIWRIRDRVRLTHTEAERAQTYAAILDACGVVELEQVEAGRQALAADARAIRLYDGVPSTLLELQRRGFKLGVITNTGATTAEKLAWLHERGLALTWDVFVSSCEVGLRKPDAAIYRLALEQAGVAAADAVFVGHAADELVGARGVGMYTVACRPDPDATAAVVVAAFAALLDLPVLASPGTAV